MRTETLLAFQLPTQRGRTIVLKFFLDQCYLKTSIFEFWFCTRSMGRRWSTSNRAC